MLIHFDLFFVIIVIIHDSWNLRPILHQYIYLCFVGIFQSGGILMNKIIVLTALLVSSISELSKVSIIVTATNETISSKDAAEILCNNFDDFRLSINDQYSFDGNYCERFITVYSVNEEVYTLVDFNGSNGYILIGDNMQSYDFKFEGEFNFSDENEQKIVFSNGLYYYPNLASNDLGINDADLKSSAFIGQELNGYGGITEPNDYVVDRYDSKYLLKKFDSFNITPNLQSDYNIYVSPTGNSEQNCTIVAAYTALSYIRSTKFINIPNISVSYTPSIQESNLYNLYVNQKNYTSVKYNHVFNNLFVQLRNRAINRGYNPYNGMNIGDTSGIIEDVSGSYGYSIDGVELINYTPNFSTVISQISLDKPMLWSTLSDPSYGSHVMVVNGYRQYHKTEKVWIFTNNYYANLLAIYDGWSNSQRYFDITAYGSALNGGALVRFDYAI
jgi:hypothetical protein